MSSIKANTRAYRGRFAPSTTGALHLGSLFVAVAGYLDAKANQGTWRLRLDDLDASRNQAGAEGRIQHSLEQHGLLWDGAVIRQSERLERYQAALDSILSCGLAFFCTCTRALLKSHTTYPGTCRRRAIAEGSGAWRMQSNDRLVVLHDRLASGTQWRLQSVGGDIMLVRRDGVFGYHLTGAVDDARPEITHVVRGRDLLAETPRQRYIQWQLNLDKAEYAHLPVLVDTQGNKLSKQHGAPALDDDKPSTNIEQVLTLLGLKIPIELSGAAPGILLEWAESRWTLKSISKVEELATQ